MTLRIGWVDRTSFDRFANSIEDLSDGELRRIGGRALNHVGRKARTQVRRALAKQTGLSYGVMKEAIRERPAHAGRLEYSLLSEGGDVRLKHFKPRETPLGVIAYPFGKRQLYRGAFIRGGAFPDRKEITRWKGHVMDRVTTDRYPVRYERSGVIIPDEMVKNASSAAFYRAMEELPGRIAHDIGFSRELRIFTAGAVF